jgi:hypothetical protein
MAESTTGMTVAEMKSVLNVSKRQPVKCAFGIGKDPGLALLLLDKMKTPMAVKGALLEKFPETKSERWGTASVDIDVNPKLVKFLINKEVTGMARRLIKTLKGTGYTRVVILREDGTEVEAYEEADPDADAANGGSGEDAATAAASTAKATEAVDQIPKAPPPSLPDIAALRRLLGEQVPRIAAVTDPDRKAKLATIATLANAKLKANDAARAEAAITGLRSALDSLAAAAATAPAGKTEVHLGVTIPSGTAMNRSEAGARWRAARETWSQASATVDGQISSLQSVLRASGTQTLVEIADAGLNGVTGNHKVRLMAMLTELGDGTPDAMAKAGPKARKLLEEFAGHIASDPRVAACDNNPFGVTVSIRATIGPALQGLQAALAA